MNVKHDLRSGLDALRQQIGVAAYGAPQAAHPAGPSLIARYPWLKRYRRSLLGALLLFLVWVALTRGFAAYLAEADPDAALWFNSAQPIALVRIADVQLNPVAEPSETAQPPGSNPSPEDQGELVTDPFPEIQSTPSAGLDEIEALAEKALRHDPLNARAIRILGQLANRKSNPKAADALMKAAATRSLHESYAVYWTMFRSYDAGEYDDALRYADILLRTRHQVQPYVMPLVAKLAETPEAADKVKALLAENPPWRPQFFGALPRSITDARTPLELFLALEDMATPPTSSDLRSYLDFLVQKDFHELAYYAWLQFLPPEQLARLERLFNGGFETEPSGLPFDWRFQGGSGATIQVAERPDHDGGKALLLEFGPGRVEFGGVSQFVLLPPGDYRLEGTYKSDLVSQRGLLWRVLCGSDAIGASAAVMGAMPTWSSFAVAFTVPGDCPVQTIKLALDARSTSETFVSGSIWYDDLRIARLEPPEPSDEAATVPGDVAPEASGNASSGAPDDESSTRSGRGSRDRAGR